MQQKAGAQISRKAFVQSLLILLLLMIVAGVLTHAIPAGTYVRTELDGREIIDPQSYRVVERPDYPVWRWFTAPVEVLWGPDAVTLITILVFIFGSGGVLRRFGPQRDSQAGHSANRAAVRRPQVPSAAGDILRFHADRRPLRDIRGGSAARAHHARPLLLPGLGFPGRPGHEHPGHQHGVLGCHHQPFHHRRGAEDRRAATLLWRLAQSVGLH